MDCDLGHFSVFGEKSDGVIRHFSQIVQKRFLIMMPIG